MDRVQWITLECRTRRTHGAVCCRV